MRLHHFKYALKILIKNKMLIFWTFAFPIILGIFFHMAFSNIETSEKFQAIEVGVVTNEENMMTKSMKSALEMLGNEDDENAIFHLHNLSLENAEESLKNKKITAYILLQEKPKVVIHSNSIESTITKQVMEQIVENQSILMNIAEKKMAEMSKEEFSNPEVTYDEIYQKIIEEINLQRQNINTVDKSPKKLSYTMIEFYTLLAMSALYGGIFGLISINQILANMSSKGKRVAVSPEPKKKLVIGSVIASYLVQLIGIFLLFFFTIFVLHVDYGENIPGIVLLLFVSSLTGLSLGVFIATISKASENTKTGILISLTMFTCFLSGMMGVSMKYIVDSNIPFINQINPASRITDGFYSLYYNNDFSRYFENIFSLLLIAIILIGISVHTLRRQQYDSI